jgi:Kdo2-lipid IVA lauroyltransferase/acyltransferase
MNDDVAEELAPAAAPLRAAWWLRAIAYLPWWAMYGLASLLAWLALRVFPYRQRVVHENLSRAFPQLDAHGLRALRYRYYLGFAQMLVELLKSPSMTEQEIRERVTIPNVELARAHLAEGRPVLLIAAHQCNWEWMLLALSLELGYPLDAAYKPLVNPWAQREMLALRTRFGSRLIPAKTLLAQIIKNKGEARAIAMVADQEPVSSERKHWTRFLNRDTAFFMGPEEITRVTRYAALFVGMRRLARGRYEMQFQPLAQAGERLAPGVLTERYARLVEEQIRAAPADWPWSHKRWKLKKPLYAGK